MESIIVLAGFFMVVCMIVYVIGTIIFSLTVKMPFKMLSKKIVVGMSFEDVNAMMSRFPVTERGYNRHNELVVVYRVKFIKLSKDYESTTVVFDESGQVVDVSRGYHRTRTY